jgi:hypothetical protein
MQGFRDALSDCELEDLGFTGDKFTWQGGRLRERLDRAVANQRWIIMFPMAGVINENFSKSDHNRFRSILLSLQM